MPYLDGKCHDNAGGIVSGITNGVSDFLIITLPNFEICKMQSSLQKRLAWVQTSAQVYCGHLKPQSLL
jgi:hypothetical protein